MRRIKTEFLVQMDGVGKVSQSVSQEAYTHTHIYICHVVCTQPPSTAHHTILSPTPPTGRPEQADPGAGRDQHPVGARPGHPAPLREARVHPPAGARRARHHVQAQPGR